MALCFTGRSCSKQSQVSRTGIERDALDLSIDFAPCSLRDSFGFYAELLRVQLRT